MPLTTGTRLGGYEITGAIGAGGMGEVYRARDTKLGREVAVKVLPPVFAADPDRLARFEREARTLASLNHPNIAQIYGTLELSPEGGSHGLVMELVDGDDLSQRLERGPIPLDEAIQIAKQIADGLAAAHEQGIIHRDLKPANVKVRPNGIVKVLDFGLAKAMDPADAGIAQGFSPGALNSPTFTSPVMTQMGVILGTAAYMAPEQARGKVVDRRADIWAFGCLLFEMLTGSRPFAGDDTSMTLAAILKQDVDFAPLPVGTPQSIRRLLRRCLEKDPRKRLQSIADAVLELEDTTPEPLAVVAAARFGWRTPLMWGIAGAIAASAVFAAFLLSRRDSSDSAAVVRSQVALPTHPLRLSGRRAFAINPAGTEIVFAGMTGSANFQLFRRRLADDEVTPIGGTEGAGDPFFSPDGQWLAFTQNSRLLKMAASGAAAIDLAETPGAQGGSFLPDGSIIFNGQHGEGLFRVNAGDAKPTALTTVDAAGEAGHHWPHVLPGGTHMLFTVEVDGKSYSEAQIVIAKTDGAERRVLIAGGTDARYVPTGHILYWHDGSLWGVPFDLANRQLTGSAVVVLRDVMHGVANGYAHFSVSANGTIVYLTGIDVQQDRSLMLVDRQGIGKPLTTDRRAFETPSVSPDGSRIAVTVTAANDSLWTMELDRPSLTRITYEAENAFPTWSPDGTRLAFGRHRGGESRQLFVMPSDASTPPQTLQAAVRNEAPHSWTQNGDLLAFVRQEAASSDIWVLSMSGDGKPRPFLATRFQEDHPRFSPDGKWMAYTSDESGRSEVYVKPFPGPGQKRLVSSDGGTEPRWRKDGRELLYRQRDAIAAADVTTSPSFSASVPRALFKQERHATDAWSTWDILPDAQHFVMIQDFAQPRTAVTMVQNWFTELKQKVAAK